jgi:hypothetical protein
MKKLVNSVFPAASPLWADAGNDSSSLSSSVDYSLPRGQPVNVAIVKEDPHDGVLLERMVGRSRSLRNAAWQHRMNLAPCTGIKRAESTTNKAVTGAAISSVVDWIGEIKKVWARGSSSTLDLARVVSAAKNRLQCHYGQWSRLWKSEQKMPVSKRTADMLAVIGDQMGGLDSQTSANLPRGWNILYCLARLDRGTLEQLIEHGFIHPKLTLREAKDLVARLKGIELNNRKTNVRERLRRFAEFIRITVSDWQPDERELATETLTRLIEEIGAAETAIFKGNGNRLTFITQLGPLTVQQNNS